MSRRVTRSSPRQARRSGRGMSRSSWGSIFAKERACEEHAEASKGPSRFLAIDHIERPARTSVAGRVPAPRAIMRGMFRFVFLLSACASAFAQPGAPLRLAIAGLEHG